MADHAEIVSRGAIARPPLRPHEVYVTRRVPLVVYLKRCLRLLHGPYGKVVIKGAGSCIETAIYLAQDVVSAFGGKLKYTCRAGAEKEQPQAVPAIPKDATSSCKDSFEQRAAALFADAASKIAALEGSETALLTVSAETATAQAHDEVLSLEGGNHGPSDAALESAGIHLELNSFIRQRQISAIIIELQRPSMKPQ